MLKSHYYHAPPSIPANWLALGFGTIYTSASHYILNSTTHMLSVIVARRGFPRNLSKIVSNAPA